MNNEFVIGIVLIILSLVIALTLFAKLRKIKEIEIRNASMTVEELETHAKRMALDHSVSNRSSLLEWPIKRMNENYGDILSLYKDLNAEIVLKRSVPAAAEWLLDNFYVIEEQVKGTSKDFTKKMYNQLPVLKKGPFKGHTRVYAIATEFVSAVDGQVEENTLIRYLEAYQSHSILFDREIRVLPVMIRLALIENTRVICEKIRETQKKWRIADKIVENWWSEDVVDQDKIVQLFKDVMDDVDEANPSFVEHLFYRLRRSGRSYTNVLHYIDEHLDAFGTTTEIIAQNEHNAQAMSTVTMGNCIMSLKYVAGMNWVHLFEATSFVERILREDPDGTYSQTDVDSKGFYLRQVERMAKLYGVSELHIARTAIGLAEKSVLFNMNNDNKSNADKRRANVGYYLIDEGIQELEREQKEKKTSRNRFMEWARRDPRWLYMGTIIALTGGFVLGLSAYAGMMSASFAYLWISVSGLVVLIPASELAITIINWFVGEITEPTVFSRLELKEGIPDTLRTMVVVPALLGDVDRVEELLGNIENHYLANSQSNLFFALIGAYKDSQGPNTEADEVILRRAADGMAALNQRYSKSGEAIFYFYHRISQYNETDDHWTGWERKRGALMEFNQMLLGSEVTSFRHYSENLVPSGQIKYIITLDADTVLPLGMAIKMIGTMAHPLNLPVICPKKGIVVEGHGLMQPRISFDIESSNKSIFSRIFTGQEGIDPYASAISDVYQDLFGEGIFTGKGIYDLTVFQQVLENAVPDNAVLSHDLLEGSYLRAALVSSLELVDSYPTRYNAYTTRLHRWIRGDWQLIPWLKKHIYNMEGALIDNPLSFVSLWKITDNLRRSLVAPALVLLFLLGFSILPGSALVWSGFGLLVLSCPFLCHVCGMMLATREKHVRVKRHMFGFFGLKSSLFQLLLTIIFLPYQAWMVLSAVSITLIRVLVTKKNMLEWITSDDAEKGQKNTLGSYLFTMGRSSLVGILIIVLAVYFKPAAIYLGVLLAGIWFLAPFVAYWISLGQDQQVEQLESKDLEELGKIARKTWRYFEEFANEKNNFLAPDNYQEEPDRGIAYRTSPTNIGLGLLASLTARDMGYIGTIELMESLNRSVSTILKMEKWHGHLYNWYDTRTLEPLKPRYVSTVDSGNYVCYLITLVQGLKEYGSKPLIDPAYVKGIQQTLQCALEEDAIMPQDMTLFAYLKWEGTLNPVAWHMMLDQIQKDPSGGALQNKAWKHKSEHMVANFKHELMAFMPYLALLDGIPDGDTYAYLMRLLERNPSILDLNEANDALMQEVDRLLADEPLINESSDSAGRDWLSQFKQAIHGSMGFTVNFMEELDQLINQLQMLSDATRFDVLYNDKRHLFSIGYNIEDNWLSNSYYDLLASEARQTSYIAIARGEVPSKHWFMLGRSLTVVDQFKGLISWSGTMFEYLMPLLIMKNYKNTLLDETYSFVIKSQMKYAKQRHMPWGTSESSFNSLDIHLDYQYKAIGVPWLGLKRGLVEDAVAAPYATFLALMVSPVDAFKNIQRLKKEGLEGGYGYYEAADYTPERLEPGEKRVVIKSYMAHHQGMSLMAINNYLNDNIMQVRFYADSHVKAARLLLQEKIPQHVVYTKENKEKIMPSKGLVLKDKGSYRRFTSVHEPLPMAHILSNGNYTVMITDKGTSYSRTRSLAVTRWREDAVLDSYGMFFYIKNKDTDKKWSATHAPLGVEPDQYEVVFTADKAVYKRQDDEIETTTEIIVTSGDQAEIRRIKLKNNSQEQRTLELTSYFEVVLAPHSSDLAHPTFSNLFVETEFEKKYNALIAFRRPRSQSEKGMWMAQIPVIEGEMIGDVTYETDRMQFVGRGRTLKNPIKVERDKLLTNSVGTVLDPIFSLRIKLKIEPSEKVRVSFVTMLAKSREELYELLEKYSSLETCDASFWLAVSRSQVETRYLNIKAADMELYQNMISDLVFLSPLRRKHSSYIKLNKKGQSALWPHGISGDRPIVLVMLNKTEQVEILYEVLMAHEYWRLKDLRVDLVVLVQEENSYLNPLLAMVKDIISNSRVNDSVTRKGDIFVLNSNDLAIEEVYLLCAVSRLLFKGNGESMTEQLSTESVAALPQRVAASVDYCINYSPVYNTDLQFYNGIGGFSKEGTSYVIHLHQNQNTPAPWSNVIANPEFGFLVTESGGGFIWSGNSRENKLTPWSNDPVSDPLGDIVYLSDESKAVWTVTALPVREEETYTTTHGFGFTQFEHVSHGITQKMVQFVPVNEPIKVSLLSLKNNCNEPRRLQVTYYATPVLGVNAHETAPHIISSVSEGGTILVENPYNQDFNNQVVFMNTSEEVRYVTGDRHEFFGSGGFESPDALSRIRLSGAVGAGYDPCLAMQVEILLEPNETKEVTFVLGVGTDTQKAIDYAKRYENVAKAHEALEEVRVFWARTLQTIQVQTPEPAMNLMLNGWLMYQVIACRLWARSAFYQAGGAFGFRDQLQDSLATLSIWPELARNQIIKHARHQFIEGDVLHWWHEPTGKGTRTRISDDYLWLPYVTAEYIKVTGDVSILSVEIPFLEEELLRDYEEERYCSPRVSEETASLYEHCLRAIRNGLNFGEKGLPLMGGGDWNDGMNQVGIHKKGESVWLGWFLHTTLKNFMPICESHQDYELIEEFEEVCTQLVEAIELHGWDGNWYKRAFFDDGTPLGSIVNSECKIDSLAQSWSVISGAGDKKRAQMAMDSLEDYLIFKEDGLIKLLTPPFDDGPLEPGYIKGYVPGVRENGGQYTHAAIWAIKAYASLGDGEKALELYELINPINHSRTNTETSIYKVEPYVMSADVYSVYPHSGRGGWTWYTGSSSWMYQVGIESILGFTRRGDFLEIEPCIPSRWGSYSMTYQFMETTYEIQVINSHAGPRKVSSVTLDGVLIEGGKLPLVNDLRMHQVEVVYG